MKILAIADLHGKFFRLDGILKVCDPVDVIVVAGDLTHGGPPVNAVRTLSILKTFCKRVLFVPGNWDPPEVREEIRKHAIDLEERPTVIGNTLFLGLGSSNITGNNTPCEMTEEEIENRLKDVLNMPQMPRTVLVSHAPPYDTTDMTPAGNKGSPALRKALDRVDIIICGHIHSGRGKVKDGAWVINPGYAHDGQAAIIDLESMDIIWIDSAI
ncbi:metallophosphoesterase [Methanocella sp. CWC-04]|uniref:Metallophosphoesterase n=1 Tax=Methanooceanicella nereidis TaxID=2052831 RepID=A0AAP2W6I7_9EURY|nr:metallophosphoesterase [Methanocella sp. CWC-04]MCD1295378.1 metallophosphoesterase [Methanocella sp. CWC-04]